jgi:hypothetical protein
MSSGLNGLKPAGPKYQARRHEETIGVILEAGRNQERLPISWVWITGIRSDL